MLDISQVREFLIKPALDDIGLYSEGAEELLVATMAQESLGGTYIVQRHGPALGIYQMEPTTHDDIWNNYLKYHPDLAHKIIAPFSINSRVGNPGHEEVMYNLRYATQMARIHYYRFPDALPAKNDLNGIWQVYKRRYNSISGSATIDSFMANYKKFTHT